MQKQQKKAAEGRGSHWPQSTPPRGWEPGGLFQAMRYFGYGRVGKEVSVTKSGAFCNGRGVNPPCGA